MRAQQTLSDESMAAVAIDEHSGVEADGTIVGGNKSRECMARHFPSPATQ